MMTSCLPCVFSASHQVPYRLRHGHTIFFVNLKLKQFSLCPEVEGRLVGAQVWQELLVVESFFFFFLELSSLLNPDYKGKKYRYVYD